MIPALLVHDYLSQQLILFHPNTPAPALAGRGTNVLHPALVPHGSKLAGVGRSNGFVNYILSP
jgi:hypothetical protein